MTAALNGAADPEKLKQPFPATFKGLQDQSDFHNNAKTLPFFFHCVHMYTDSAKVILSETAGDFAKIRAVAPNYTRSPCILHY